MNHSLVFALLVLGTAPSWVQAAPLDALLSANKSATPGQVEMEAAYDVVNSTVDVFGVRDNDQDFSGTNVGDYHGYHLRAGVTVTPRFWLEAGLWQRRIDYRQDQATIDSWQLAGQYKLLTASGAMPDVAARFGVWGNRANHLDKNSPTQFLGATLNNIQVDDANDKQYQLDLIATWPLQSQLEFTTFAGAGYSEVRVGSISGTGTATRNGCNYNIAFSGSTLLLTLAQPCGQLAALRYEEQNNTPYKETEYSAWDIHAGLSGKWTHGPWVLRAGYAYLRLNRDRIDDLVAARGASAVKSNHIVIGEIAYRLSKHMAIFGRAQYMRHQFTGEVPLAYNTFTAQRFDKQYGIVSIGITVDF